MTTFAATGEQRRAVEGALDAVQSRGKFRITTGLAGSGKTFVATEVARQLFDAGVKCRFFARTGKAADNLRRRGPLKVEASTVDALLKSQRYGPRHYEVGIVDEASQLEVAHHKLLLSSCDTVLYFGDPAQLGPYGNQPSVLDLYPCDFHLQEVHRQDESSKILSLARLIAESRLRKWTDFGFYEEGVVEHYHEGDIPREDLNRLLCDVDQVITPRNEPRLDLVRRMRSHRGHASPFPCRGDRLVGLSNIQKKPKLFTGSNALAISDAHCEDDRLFVHLRVGRSSHAQVRIDPRPFKDPTKRWPSLGNLHQVYFADCRTIYNSQGDEWDSVLVLDDGTFRPSSKTWRRTMYTAVSRARKRLTILSPQHGAVREAKPPATELFDYEESPVWATR